MHSEEETYRATVQARDLDGGSHTVIVMRRGLGRNARVWVTVNGAWKTTLQMPDPDAARLAEVLIEAQRPADNPSLLYEYLALRRVSQGGVAKLGSHWLDGGRPVPCFLPAALNELIEAGLLELTDLDPENMGQCRATLTDAGAGRYATLNEGKQWR